MHCSTNQGVQIACGLFLSLLVSSTSVPSGLNKDDLYKRKKYKQEREVKHVLFTHFFHLVLNWNFVPTLLLCWFVPWGQILKETTAKEAPSDFCQKQHLYIFTCIYIYIHVYTCIYIYIYMCNYVRVFQFNHFYNTIFSCKNKIKDTWVNIGSFRFPYVFPPSKGCLVWRWCTH